MRLSLVSTAFLATFLATSSYAADLPAREAPIVYVPAFTWAGLYVGLNAGVGWAGSRDVVVTGPTPATSGILSGSGNDGTFVGGAQIGYNWQSGAIVYGLEADIQYVDTGGNVNWAIYDWWAQRGGDDGGYFGSVRARVGYAIDRTLIYITGGLGYGGLNNNPLTGNSTSNTGWTIGGGIEYAFTNNWIFRVEGLYVDLTDSRKTHVFVNPPGGVLPPGTYTATADKGNGAGLLRVGVNYKF